MVIGRGWPVLAEDVRAVLQPMGSDFPGGEIVAAVRDWWPGE